ncbi:MAG: Maf family protein [Selenomonadaceae bacterium]
MIILASASPRRKKLLEQIGCKFKVMVSDATEEMRQDLLPEKVVIRNARLKAMDVAAKTAASVLGADTVVSLEGHIYGKPANAYDARRMLKILSGNIHEVSTGIALVRGNGIWTDVVTTKVKFCVLSDTVIDDYIASKEPFDKAGAYAIQGRAAAFIERIEGCYSNVVGLPLYCLTVLAKEAGVNLYDDNGEVFTRR